MGTLQKDVCSFMIISHWIILKMRNVSYKSWRQNCAIYKTMWKNIVEPDMAQMIPNMVHALCMPDNKAKNTQMH
jgi:hypothetical protein